MHQNDLPDMFSCKFLNDLVRRVLDEVLEHSLIIMHQKDILLNYMSSTNSTPIPVRF